MSRWLNWIDCFEWHSSSWHMRLLVLSVVGLQQGWLPGKSTSIAQEKLGSWSTLGQDTATTKESKETLARLRDKAKHTMHLAHTIISNPRHLTIGRIITACSRSLRLWFGEAIKRARSPGECCALWVDLAAGEGSLRALHGCTQPLTNLLELEWIGFKVDMSPDSTSLAMLVDDHPTVCAEQQLAKELQRFIVELFASRVRGLFENVFGLPARFALFLHSEASVRGRFMQSLKDLDAAWNDVQALDNAAWARVRKRC